MGRILDTLRRKKLLVSDGAWGTMLMARGLEPGSCPEIWNVEHPAEVADIAAQYAAAGADLITTNSFGATRCNLDRHGFGARTAELNRAAAALSREAAGADHFIHASVGPSGRMLLMDEISEEDLYEIFREQMLALAEGGADACCIETMSALDEALIAVRAAKENTDLEVICTFSFDREISGNYHTMMGITPAATAEALVAAGADIIGANCGQGAEGMVAIVRELHAAAPHVPILVQPNAGLPVHSETGDTYPESPLVLAQSVPALVAAGARIIGGCCGTTPAHIRAVAEAVESMRNRGQTA